MKQPDEWDDEGWKVYLTRLARLAASRRTNGPAYKHTRWARCVYCGILSKYKVSRARRLRTRTCQECNRKGGLHPENWKGWSRPGVSDPKALG